MGWWGQNQVYLKEQKRSPAPDEPGPRKAPNRKQGLWFVTWRYEWKRGKGGSKSLAREMRRPSTRKGLKSEEAAKEWARRLQLKSDVEILEIGQEK